jgi:uncharacterized protein (DUF488 family)
MKLYTIGHSNHSLEKFLGLLKENGISLLVDVRSAPYSRYHPQFNKDNLEGLLPRNAIEYAFAGQVLGGRPSDPGCYKGGILPDEGTDFLHKVNYSEVMKRPWFVQGVHRLLELAAEQPAVIMCSEEDPAHCHRHHLIAKYLLKEHPEVGVRHIRGDGTVYGAGSIKASVDEPPAEQLKFF